MYALELEKNWTEIGNYTVTLQCVVIVQYTVYTLYRQRQLTEYTAQTLYSVQ